MRDDLIVLAGRKEWCELPISRAGTERLRATATGASAGLFGGLRSLPANRIAVSDSRVNMPAVPDLLEQYRQLARRPVFAFEQFAAQFSRARHWRRSGTGRVRLQAKAAGRGGAPIAGCLSRPMRSFRWPSVLSASNLQAQFLFLQQRLCVMALCHSVLPVCSAASSLLRAAIRADDSIASGNRFHRLSSSGGIVTASGRRWRQPSVAARLPESAVRAPCVRTDGRETG